MGTQGSTVNTGNTGSTALTDQKGILVKRKIKETLELLAKVVRLVKQEPAVLWTNRYIRKHW